MNIEAGFYRVAPIHCAPKSAGATRECWKVDAGAELQGSYPGARYMLAPKLAEGYPVGELLVRHLYRVA